MKVWEITFSKYNGENKWILAENFDDAVKLAHAWGKKHKFGNDLDKIELAGEIDE